jgi:hypothetical protein
VRQARPPIGRVGCVCPTSSEGWHVSRDGAARVLAATFWRRGFWAYFGPDRSCRRVETDTHDQPPPYVCRRDAVEHVLMRESSTGTADMGSVDSAAAGLRPGSLARWWRERRVTRLSSSSAKSLNMTDAGTVSPAIHAVNHEIE